ncbi:hypothetical protein [Nocardia sp. 348MFTsu5.1]|uniref:hypothetical protein n=1 Tax=Nocardia sp. 348MFTsu5.1 TaxID=1172185 RepID=UPI000374476F|nr:hypothetical protein [Nocardia sp. 348MFTsu5.1]
MATVVKVDRDALVTLAIDLWAAARGIRAIDVHSAFSDLLRGMPGSDVAAACATAERQIESALESVATRVDALAQKNALAGSTYGITDEQYADSITGLLKL